MQKTDAVKDNLRRAYWIRKIQSSNSCRAIRAIFNKIVSLMEDPLITAEIFERIDVLQKRSYNEDERDDLEDLSDDVDDEMINRTRYKELLKTRAARAKELKLTMFASFDDANQLEPSTDFIQLKSTLLYNKTWRKVEKELILKTLIYNCHCRTTTAKKLGISVRTLRNKLNTYVAEEKK